MAARHRKTHARQSAETFTGSREPRCATPRSDGRRGGRPSRESISCACKAAARSARPPIVCPFPERTPSRPSTDDLWSVLRHGHRRRPPHVRMAGARRGGGRDADRSPRRPADHLASSGIEAFLPGIARGPLWRFTLNRTCDLSTSPLSTARLRRTCSRRWATRSILGSAGTVPVSTTRPQRPAAPRSARSQSTVRTITSSTHARAPATAWAKIRRTESSSGPRRG
jgi:hypothetical protein